MKFTTSWEPETRTHFYTVCWKYLYDGSKPLAQIMLYNNVYIVYIMAIGPGEFAKLSKLEDAKIFVDHALKELSYIEIPDKLKILL
jgi:hypothetical protein